MTKMISVTITMSMFIVIVGLLALGAIDGLKVARPKLTSLKQWSDNEYLNVSFAVDDTVPYMNFTFNVLKELQDVAVHIEAQVSQKNDPSYFVNTNVTFNLCRLLSLKDRSTIGMLAFAFLKEHGKLAEKCPVEKGTYTVHRIWYPEEPAQPEWSDFVFNGKVQAYSIEGANKRLIMDDSWEGHSIVKEVPSLQNSLFSLLKP